MSDGDPIAGFRFDDMLGEYVSLCRDEDATADERHAKLDELRTLFDERGGTHHELRTTARALAWRLSLPQVTTTGTGGVPFYAPELAALRKVLGDE